MKTKICEYIDELRDDYIRAFRKTLNENPGLSAKELHELAIESGAPQWYCSEKTALRAISAIDRGCYPEDIFTNGHKRRKYLELHRLFKERMMQTHESRWEVISDLLLSPAPSFYMSYRTARWYILLNRKKKRYEKDNYTVGRN